MKLVVSQAAQADLLRLHKFLSDKNPEAARRVVSAIVGAIDSLDLFPDRGKPIPNVGMRELIVAFGQSAYIIRYANDPARGELAILRIWHSRESRD